MFPTEYTISLRNRSRESNHLVSSAIKTYWTPRNNRFMHLKCSRQERKQLIYYYNGYNQC